MRPVGGFGGKRHNRRARRGLLLVFWLVLAEFMIGRSIQVQVLERDAWMQDALRQHRMTRVVPAPRGRILDRNGGELAVSHWRARVGIATEEILDRDDVAQALLSNLGLSRTEARRVSGPTRSWHVVPGRYSMTQVAPLRGIRGVHVEGELRRLYPREGLARGLLGIVLDGAGREGVEQSMDSVLTGSNGREIVARDHRGREIPGQVVTMQPAVAGRDVVLTIDQDLQAISEEMLANALESSGSRGGDLIVTDPRTGEILAMTSVVNGSVGALSAVNTSYEPGSTIKPFTTAALLRHGVASLADSVDTGHGSWVVNGRTITDVQSAGWMSLHDVVLESSNVGIAKFADRLTSGQQYTTLRDFGFGTPTGIALPAEAKGLLRRPEMWTNQSAHSLAFGYELSVTPLQMAMAFGALANGGILMEPLLIKEVHNQAGEPVRFGRPRAIRRVLPEWVSETLTPVLVDVVDNGTGALARMSSFQVAGKSGTARATGSDGRYEDGAYHSSFGAWFPADDPQLLFFVKLDRPTGAYYGGAVAAPVTRATLESLLSARQSPIDRAALARAQRDRRGPPAAAPLVHFAVATEQVAAQEPAEMRAWTAVRASSTAPEREMIVPDLEGASLRVALRRLHKMGLRVRLEGGGAVAATVPRGGTGIRAGDTIRVVGRGT